MYLKERKGNTTTRSREWAVDHSDVDRTGLTEG